MELARAFVALALGAELGAGVGARVSALLDRSDWRLARPEGLHVTLAFLGSVERVRLEKLGAPFAEALVSLRAPALELTHGGAFPSWGRPRVLWIGAEERGEAGRLERCRAAVAAALHSQGFGLGDELGRPFRPHVTVARPRSRRVSVPVGFRALTIAAAWRPPAVTLYESRPAAGGSRYEPLASWPFGARDMD